MLSAFLSRIIILLFGTLYPAYASYKAVKTKNLKEYVKWMMYWIVFALFTCVETFADVILSFWMPLYYEIKILFLFWLLSPWTKGSSCLYRKFVHPELSRREKEIDDLVAKARAQGYSTLVNYGAKGLTLASKFVAEIALKGQYTLMNQLKKSQSLNDIPHYPLQYYNQDNGHGSVKNNLYFLNESMMDDDMADENEYIDDRFNGVITFNDRSARFSKPDNTILEEEGGNIDNRKSFDEYEEEVDSILASRKKINKTHMTRRMKPLITHNTRNKQIPDDQISYATIPRAVKRGKTRKPLLDDHKKFHEEDKINC